jgi:hypothetical protein
LGALTTSRSTLAGAALAVFTSRGAVLGRGGN